MTLFESLISEGEELLAHFCFVRQAETVELEFKQKATPTHPRFEKDDKRNLGKALSAFANSAGGVLVFGVRAASVGGVDGAVSLHPIDEYEKFATEALNLVGQYLMPRHDGIRIHAFPSAERTGSGYVTIAVERSERRPHQSKAPDDGRYYKRAGESTFVMEHYDIEDAFKRVAPPTLSLEHSIYRAGQSNSPVNGLVVTLNINLFIRVETASARAPFIHLMGGALMAGTNHRFENVSSLGEARYEAGADVILHPEISHQVCSVRLDASWGPNDRGVLINGQPIFSYIHKINYRIGAEGVRTVTGIYEILGKDLATFLPGG